MENSPWPCESMPRPWQRGHTRGLVPGLAPVPRQVVHVDDVVTDRGICAPSIACSKLIVTSASRSRPRSGRGRAPAPAPPPRVPNRLLRMSEKPPGSKPPPAPPAAPPPNGLPPANGFRRWPSYCLRLSASPRTSYACEISLKRSSAPGSELVSGWYVRASLRYAFLISS